MFDDVTSTDWDSSVLYQDLCVGGIELMAFFCVIFALRFAYQMIQCKFNNQIFFIISDYLYLCHSEWYNQCHWYNLINELYLYLPYYNKITTNTITYGRHENPISINYSQYGTSNIIQRRRMLVWRKCISINLYWLLIL